MCFIVTNKRVKIAKKNIVCYKFSAVNQQGKDFTFLPYFQNCFTYKKNKPTLKVELTITDDNEINRGYHSYNTLKACRDNSMSKTRIGKFIIPKGTRYYESKEYDEYVSESLIFKGYIK